MVNGTTLKKDGYMAKNETLIIDNVRYKFNYNGTY